MTLAAQKGERRLVIVGDTALAEIAFEFFTRDSPYHVAAFAVDRPFLRQDHLLGRPVVALDEAGERYPPATHDLFVAVSASRLNRLRHDLMDRGRALGYRLATYVSSRAHVWPNAQLGENCMVFPTAVVDPFARVGEGVILWTGSLVGHHSTVGPCAFLSMNATVCGFASVGAHAFLGAGCTVADRVEVAADSLVGAGVCLRHPTTPGAVYAAPAPQRRPGAATDYFATPSPGAGPKAGDR